MASRQPPATLVIDVKTAVSANGDAFWQSTNARLSLSPTESLHGILGESAYHEVDHMNFAYSQAEGKAHPLGGWAYIRGNRAAQIPRIGYSHAFSFDEPSAFLAGILREMTFGSALETMLVQTSGGGLSEMNGYKFIYKNKKAGWSDMGSDEMVNKLGIGLDMARKNIFAAASALEAIEKNASGLLLKAEEMKALNGISRDAIFIHLPEEISLRLEFPEGLHGDDLILQARSRLKELLNLSLNYETLYAEALKAIDKKRLIMSVQRQHVPSEPIETVPAFRALFDFNGSAQPTLTQNPSDVLKNDIYEKTFNEEYKAQNSVRYSPLF